MRFHSWSLPPPSRSLLKPLVGCLLVVLVGSEGQAQQERATGAAYPTRAELLAVPIEHPFVPEKRFAAPERVDLSQWFPEAGDQGRQASCSGWALGYALSAYHCNRMKAEDTRRSKETGAACLFSPAFIYDLLVKKDGLRSCDEGVVLTNAVKLVCDTGCAPWDELPYDTTLSACMRPVPGSAIAKALDHRLQDARSIGNRDWAQWKYHLAQGLPVVFLTSIDPDYFAQGARTQGKAPFVWAEPFPTDWSGRVGHIMVCTGYTDSGFVALNSCGPDWGNKGYVHIPDSTLYWACSDAYVLGPPAATEAVVLKDEPRPKRSNTMDLVKGGLGKREVHRTGAIIYQVHEPTDDRPYRIALFDAESGAPIRTLGLREDQPITVEHAGDLYTFTHTGKGLLSRQFRYALQLNGAEQEQLIQEELRTFDLHADGRIDGRW